MDRAIQYMDTARDEQQAREWLAGLSLQAGYLGGRVLPPSPANPRWRVQGFFESNGEPMGNWLPDGCRHVIIPAGQRKALGIR